MPRLPPPPKNVPMHRSQNKEFAEPFDDLELDAFWLGLSSASEPSAAIATDRHVPEQRAAAPAPTNSTAPTAPVQVSNCRGKKWTDHEKDKLFNFVLGPDHDSNFALSKVNKGKLFEKAAQHIGGRDAAAIERQWNSAMDIYKALDAFRRVTGGGGDGDRDIGDREGWDWTDGSFLEQRLADAVQKGRVSSGDLTVKAIQLWETKGWYKLFKGRLQDDPKIHREVAISSANDISPQRHPQYYGHEEAAPRTSRFESFQHAPGATSPNSASPGKSQPTRPMTVAQQHKSSTHDMMSEMTRFLGDRNALDQKRMDITQARMDLKVKEAEIKAWDSKYAMLIKVRDDPNSTAELKELAEKKLKSMLEDL
ncbi:Histone acetyltransferase [Stygiomarasmius scandens]|uniref:Histone acetyltransferase n=1 Tax=Marasmiellus scandens TaxID=2682957 RepID=A0ABR1JFY0_9AGAR